METKKPTTYEQQITLLRDRGCIIDDENFCKETLSTVNYYRLTAYFLPFKESNNAYHSGISFYQVYRIYEFDRRLRSILLSALEEIEIYLRSQISYYHAHKYGATGYLNTENYCKKHQHDKFTKIINEEIQNNAKVPFVKHHIDKYQGVFPIWVLCELFTFGMLSRFVNDLKTADQKYIARNLYKTTHKNLCSWLLCCTHIRNICAHYGRLYYRTFSAIPSGFDLPPCELRSLWAAILAVRELYPNNQKWNTNVLNSLVDLFDEYSSDICLHHISFPNDWYKRLAKPINSCTAFL